MRAEAGGEEAEDFVDMNDVGNGNAGADADNRHSERERCLG